MFVLDRNMKGLFQKFPIFQICRRIVENGKQLGKITALNSWIGSYSTLLRNLDTESMFCNYSYFSTIDTQSICL